MKFKFKRKESVAEAVQRISRGCVDEALDGLKEKEKFEAIHSVRKEIKKLRAVLRLVRGEIGEGPFKKGNRCLREAADELAGPRDAYVQVKALDGLAPHRALKCSSQHFREMHTALAKECHEKAIRFRKSGSAKVVQRLLRRQSAKFEKLQIEKGGWSLIGAAIKRSYSAGREALEQARLDPSAENFHEWRKRVKDLWHYVQLLQPAWPRQMSAMTKVLEELGEYLGDDHDLHMLKQATIRKLVHNGPEGETGRLIEVIDARRRELQIAALTVGSGFYAAKPSSFCDELHRYWKAWRSRSKKERKNVQQGRLFLVSKEPEAAKTQ